MKVQLPDGTTVDGVPEGTTKQQLAEKLRANGRDVPQEWLGTPVPAPATPSAPQPPQGPQTFVEGANVPLGGMMRGALDIAGIPGDAATLAERGLRKLEPYLPGKSYAYPGQTVRPSPIGAEALKGYAEKSGLLPPEPTTGPERAISRGTEFLTAGGASALKAGAGLAKEGFDAARAGINTLRGVEVPTAQRAASEGSREALTAGAAAQEQLAGQRQQYADVMEKVRGELDKRLEASKVTPIDLNQQGDIVRGSFTAAMQSAKDARKAATEPLFAQVYEIAKAKEATGARVNTAEIEKSLKDMKKESEGIPDLESNVDKMLSAIRGRSTAAPQPPGPRPAWAGPGYQAPQPQPAQSLGKSFEQLELTRRYLNDIAYNGEIEGYSAIVRNRARDTAKSIDNAMQEFVPEFGQYKNTYRQLSEPLDSISTRLGKAISDTEGGIKGDVYSKIGSADLPGKLFAKKEGIDLLTDALAGGKNATPEARAAAAKQVDGMVENWILESVRTKSPQASVDFLQAPKTRAALSGVPQLESKLTTRFKSMQALEDTSAQLGKFSEQMGKKAETATVAANKLKNDIAIGDSLAELPGALSQQKAYEAYTNALARARSAQLIPPEQYKAAIQLMDRAQTLEEKTRIARRLAAIVGGTTGVIAGEEAVRKLIR